MSGSEVAARSPLKRELLRELAALRADSSSFRGAEPPVVLVSDGHPRDALFLVHPVLGVAFPYFELATLLGGVCRVYGLESFDATGAMPQHASVEAMASYYADRLIEVQPEGPYLVGGWSFGAIVAYEMAQELSWRSAEVRDVVLLDTWAPRSGTVLDSIGLLGDFARGIWPFFLDYAYLSAAKGSVGARLRDGMAQAVQSLTATRSSLEIQAQLGTHVGVRADVEVPALVRAMMMNARIMSDYRAKPYPGHVTLLRTSKSSRSNRDDATCGWGELVHGGVDVRHVSGTHMTILKRPHVERLAAELVETLRTRTEAENGRGAPTAAPCR